MSAANFILANTEISSRFRFYLKDENQQIRLTGQIREVKPMCLDEIKWIRKVAAQDSFFERVKKDDGYLYILRANDAHELGRGNLQPTEELMNKEIEYIKTHAPGAGFIDETPEEKRIRARDYIVSESAKLLKDMGLDYS